MVARGLFRVGSATTPTVPTTPTYEGTPLPKAWIPDFASGITVGSGDADFAARWPVDRGIDVVTDPIRGDRKVIRFTCLDSYVAPMTPTENPRCQLEGPALIGEGTEFWAAQGLYFPADRSVYPDVTQSDGWIGFQGIWGPPWQGSSPWRVVQLPGDRMTIDRNATYNWDKPWQRTPFPRGKWFDMAWHGLHSNDPTKGWYELWINEGSGWVQQTLNNGAKRIYMQTRSDGQNGGPNHMSVTSYRLKGMYESATHYVARPALARTLTEADPGSYR